MTANGTEISDGASLSGSQVVRVYGDNLTPPYFSLWLNGVDYTPLDYGDGYVEYLLQDNGTYEIRNERDVVMEFSISGAIVPSVFPTDIYGYQCNRDSAYYSGDTTTNAIIKRNVNCINYPYKVNNNYPYFLFRFDVEGVAVSDLVVHNGTIGTYRIDGTRLYINVAPTDVNSTCYIEYEGFIIAVFNYTTTP